MSASVLKSATFQSLWSLLLPLNMAAKLIFKKIELFTGIDVSLTETTEQHAARLGAYIDYFQIQSGIIIFSDLISLEELWLSLIQQLQIPFILVGCTSVNTVSSFGKALLCHNSHFFETLTPQYSFPCYIHQPKQREKILLAVCQSVLPAEFQKSLKIF